MNSTVSSCLVIGAAALLAGCSARACGPDLVGTWSVDAEYEWELRLASKYSGSPEEAKIRQQLKEVLAHAFLEFRSDGQGFTFGGIEGINQVAHPFSYQVFEDSEGACLLSFTNDTGPTLGPLPFRETARGFCMSVDIPEVPDREENCYIPYVAR